MVGYVERLLLEELGLSAGSCEFEVIAAEILEETGTYPETAKMAELARSYCSSADPVGDPDGALLKWLEAEEKLFFALEKLIEGPSIRKGFVKNNRVDFEAFIARSLSIQNRRKSRRGRSLEHHLTALFLANDLSFTPQGTTEGKSRPDFIFPSIEAYHAREFPVDALFMVAAKSSCKDRWRQILAEAERVEVKHLVTLEFNLSDAQLREMERQGVIPVVPCAERDRDESLRTLQWLISVLSSSQVLLSQL